MHNDHSHTGGSADEALLVASRTHVGLRRENNQDFLAVRSLGERGMLLLVADGMGGHQGGERASRLAAERFIEVMEKGEDAGEEVLTKALAAANEAVVRESAANEELRGMGTTLVAAVVQDANGTVINLGDSRAYLLRGGELHQVTHDHSLVAEMVRRGEITEAEAEGHPRRNVLTRAVGVQERPEPDLFSIDLAMGDVLLLCTDGLHGMIGDGEIRNLLGASWSLDARCDALIDAALDGGGKDNVTVLLVQRGERGEVASGPVTDQGYGDRRNSDRGYVEESRESVETNESTGRGWLYLLGIVLVGAVIWGAIEFGLFRSDSDPEVVPDTLDFDTTGLLLDSSVQLTPSDRVNDSIWGDSLSVPAEDSLRRDSSRR